MNPVLSIGAAGLKAAGARLAIHASSIVQAPVRAATRIEPVQTERGGHPAVYGRRVASSGRPFSHLAGDLTGMRTAAHAYRASAAIVRTGDAMTRTLLDTLA
jgi:hypothetical protein